MTNNNPEYHMACAAGAILSAMEEPEFPDTMNGIYAKICEATNGRPRGAVVMAIYAFMAMELFPDFPDETRRGTLDLMRQILDFVHAERQKGIVVRPADLLRQMAPPSAN